MDTFTIQPGRCSDDAIEISFAPTINAQGTPIFPTTRPNPNIGWLSINESTAHSTYDGLTLSLTRRLAQRYQFMANYTLARNRDDDSNERNFSREVELNPFDLSISMATWPHETVFVNQISSILI